ncbi:hypothetical protein MRE07_14350, partial [Clostridioides difficile]|nr:hypothetical protein [Clostridioides difficile]
KFKVKILSNVVTFSLFFIAIAYHIFLVGQNQYKFFGKRGVQKNLYLAKLFDKLMQIMNITSLTKNNSTF